MSAYDKVKSSIEELPEEQRAIALSLLSDIEFWEKKCDELKKCETFQIDPKNPLRQRKLPAHDMLKEAAQQKINAQRTLIQIFNKQRMMSDEDPFEEEMKEYDE